MTLSPQRIVCLSAEAADWLWRIGAWDKVVGVTAFFTPPKDAPPKPRVGGFSTAQVDAIANLKPDLIITFSDVQAQLALQFIQRGFPIFATNQRTLSEIEITLASLARLVDREAEGEILLREFRERLAPVENLTPRPKIYFEEWNEPFISGIAWISELIERAGGEDIFASLQTQRAAEDRIVSSEQICEGNPEIIFASWCGKPVNIASISSRPDWEELSTVRAGHIYEILSEDILQPGFRLVHGYEQIKKILQQFHVNNKMAQRGV
jgi:iron complex transport system substrate-binding protein